MKAPLNLSIKSSQYFRNCYLICLYTNKCIYTVLLLSTLCCLIFEYFIIGLWTGRLEITWATTNVTHKADYQYPEVIEKKRILLWTPHFDKSDITDYFLGDVHPFSQSDICRFNCEFTLDRNLLNSSDAVAFHGRGFLKRVDISGKYVFTPLDLPTTRGPGQSWIFYLWESPLATEAPMEAFANLFNITMSHRQDSDIFIPNARLVQSVLTNDSEIRNMVLKKTKLVAWLNSDCSTNHSRRSGLVENLQMYVEIDIYGVCGPYNCISDQSVIGKHSSWWYKTFINPCYNETGQHYKFYLAFENALCKDYITEKPFNALAAGMVPIVYGAVDYSLYLPQGSYINVNSFPSMKDLADYLHLLDKNSEKYLKYFEWRKTLKVDPVPFMARGWCALCEKLTLDALPRKEALQDFQTWWIGKNSSHCTFPNI